MRGLGTLINIGLALFGGMLGFIFGKKIKPELQETLTYANGMSVIFLSIGGTVAKMLQVKGSGFTTSGTMMMMISLAGGAVIGELLDIQSWIEKFGVWLRKKTRNDGDSSFVNAFISATCTVCIGAMAIVGSIQDGVSGDYSILMANGILDAVILCIMTASMGKGAIFSVVSIALFQGAITLAAVFAGPFMTQTALSHLSYVGNILIFCVGVNLVWKKDIRVANLLPALIIAALWP